MTDALYRHSCSCQECESAVLSGTRKGSALDARVSLATPAPYLFEHHAGSKTRSAGPFNQKQLGILVHWNLGCLTPRSDGRPWTHRDFSYLVDEFSIILQVVTDLGCSCSSGDQQSSMVLNSVLFAVYLYKFHLFYNISTHCFE